MITLEKIDQIVERTGVTYSKAKEVLEKADGDVLEALIILEQERTNFSEKFTEGFKQHKENFNLKKEDILTTLKELIQKGNVTKILVEKEGKTYLEIPVNIALSVGALSVFAGSVMIPIIAILGTGLYIGDFKIKVLKDDGTEVDVNEETQKRIVLLKGRVEEKKEDDSEEDLIDLTHVSSVNDEEN